MFKPFYIAVALVVAFQVIFQVCLAQAKGNRRRRRCPNSCVRKFTEYQKGSIGPRGQPGIPGPPGTPGVQSSSIVLPSCKDGEYLTSDGQKLICKTINLAGLCPNLKKDCQNNGRAPVNQHEGKMVKFMKKNMIQSFNLDAWDAEAFYIGNLLFIGLSQLGENNFMLYKWSDDIQSPGFKLFQKFDLVQARNWEPFVINDEQYFVIASNMINKPCPIYKWNGKVFKFEQGLPCFSAFDVEPYKVDDVQYIAVSNYQYDQPVIIFKWDGSQFNKFQTVDVTSQYVTVFEVKGTTYLGISGLVENGPYVKLYTWSGKKFVLQQILYTTYRPYELTELSVGEQQFVAIATYGEKGSETLLFRWKGKAFEHYQNISSQEARRVVAISSPMMGKNNGYMAVVNYLDNPSIYVWNDVHKFQLLQEIEAKGARDISFFEMGKNVYLILSTHLGLDVYKGAIV